MSRCRPRVHASLHAAGLDAHEQGALLLARTLIKIADLPAKVKSEVGKYVVVLRPDAYAHRCLRRIRTKRSTVRITPHADARGAKPSVQNMLRDDEWSPSEISSEHDLLSQFDARSGPGALPIPGLESILGDPGKSLEAAAGAGMPVPPAPGVLSMPVPTHMSTPTANGPSASARCLKLTCRPRLRRRGACVSIGAKHCCRESNGTRIHGAVQIVRALPRAVL